jgi:hypothetical protein
MARRCKASAAIRVDFVAVGCVNMKKTLHLITAAEWAEIKKRRETSAFLDRVSAQMGAARKRTEALIASPPPRGYLYRCTECGHPTNAEDRKCVCVLF